ncbi:TIGR03435 family protein [Acidicapsa dinghuensis]|uniref:TIGR03435 family protein n=1 Tax=Acidicapsa dinghuensis TaxID=2218256 RepID=A0ABW1EL06_9BACT|nr:TIGR03435 family protein [Acidicapsa dinghuensis]
MALFAIVPLAFAQKASPINSSTIPAKPLEFDVVSIKPNHTGSLAMINRTSLDSYSVENMSPRLILADAFGIRADLISGGPDWLNTDHYDLIAKVAGDDLPAYKALSKDQRGQMLRAVLADRFRLAVHASIKQLPGYTVAIAKSGFKLQPVSTDQGAGWGAGFGDINATGISISALCDLLSQLLKQTVVDQTGLTGLYSFHLQWEEDHSHVSASPDAGAPEPSGLPALPTALEEQLGLKLRSAKLPTTTLVIDHIERPSEN